MTEEELYAFYINMADFLDSPTGKLLSQQLANQISLDESNLISLVSKIKSPQQYDEAKDQFLTKQHEIKALKQILFNYMDIESIRIEIKRLQKKLAAAS